MIIDKREKNEREKEREASVTLKVLKRNKIIYYIYIHNLARFFVPHYS